MTHSALRAQLKTALQGVPGVPAANVHVPAPETPPTGSGLPAIVAEAQAYAITPGNLTVFTYPYRIYYLDTERTGDIAADLDATVADMPRTIFETLAAAGFSYGIYVGEPAGEIGIISWRDKTYAGCYLDIVLREKAPTVWG
jgi:hypothetical protein